MSESLNKIDAAVAAGRDTIVDFLRQLLSQSRNGEEAVQAWLAAQSEALGCTVTTQRYRPADIPMVAEFAGERAIDTGERASVLAHLPGSGEGRSVIFFAHPDSEPFVEPHGWSHDPFAGETENGRLYGWGLADDLAGIAAMVQAVAVLKAAGLKPAGDVYLASTPSKRHARGVSALLHSGVSADAAVYFHPAESGEGLREVKAFASGQLDFRIVVAGQPPQTTEPHQTGFAHRGVNPIEKAMLIFRALSDLDAERGERVLHPSLQAAVGRSTNLMLSHIAAGEPDRLSRMASSCTLGGAVSLPPGEALEDVQAQIEAVVRHVVDEDDWLRLHPPQIIWDAGVTGAEVPVSHPLYRTVAEVIEATIGEAPHINVMHTSSDIRNPMVQKGILTVGLGSLGGDLTQNHSHDEWIDIDDYVRCVQVAAGIIARWCGVRETVQPRAMATSVS
ncbi:M20/M25/M40 family metallo-hydrolase [Devosia sp. 1566]|uniref:M20 family metallopeptidase n=1 Tax=Devosia sp. 1566 TaxID=2499144 RepID=UPI0013E3AC0C|nr:M20/M25/M40 family metallo-hydrolase [Devosia sp. 1566]